ncbi:MAG: aminotransferase class IV [Bacteroidia bacterium]|jgi:branched-chain amino acid aminotransferase|nr:aminotransferase class IV [Bacteroidia bacterium]
MNRAFVYGDLLFETIKVVDGKMQLGQLHYKRLVTGANALKMIFTLTFSTFEQLVEEASQTINLKETRVRFVLYRDSSGFYTPNNNQTAFAIDVFPIQKPISLHLGIYTETYKPCHVVSNLKTGNALVYTLAGIWARENQFDDALIVNEYGHICEASSSNIFCVTQNKVLTPSLQEGCVAGVMREWVLSQLLETTFTLHEGVVTKDDLTNADAVYLTNAIYGIRQVTSINGQYLKAYQAGFPFS